VLPTKEHEPENGVWIQMGVAAIGLFWFSPRVFVFFTNGVAHFLNVPDTRKMGRMNMMFMHASIRTSDINRSIEFYTKIMGLLLLHRREIAKNNAEVAFLQDPEAKGAKLELTYYSCLLVLKLILLRYWLRWSGKTYVQMSARGITYTVQHLSIFPQRTALS
jgi:hypothetical protein